ncbi:MAG: hypothetical protein H0V84_03215 [Actinobacteria bacterium]|nr:hypothetical protein [Actinomycetota bacterium]
MAPPRRPPGQLRHTRRRNRSRRRARRVALLVLVGAALVVTGFLTAFGSAEEPGLTAGPGTAARLLPAGPPKPQVIAVASSIELQLPISQSQLTAVGFHPSGAGGLALEPFGRQANEGILARLANRLFGGGGGGLPYVQLGGGGSGPSTGAVDVGALAGTDVYSPVAGTVLGIRDYVLNGKTYGARIELQPAGEPALVVSLTRLRPDPALTVGSALEAGTSKVGTLIDFSTVERQSLARFTHDAGNHVTLEVHAASTLALDQ